MSGKKKGFPATLVFAAVVGVMAALAFWDFKRSKQKENLGENEIKIVSISPDAIDTFTIQSKDQTIEMKKDDGVWKMLQPVKDDADEAAVSGFLTLLSNSKAQPVEEKTDGSKDSNVDWKQYGFDPGVSVTLGGGKIKDVFDVSDKPAFDGSFYIRKGNQLLIGDRSWAHIADKQVNVLRSHLIWRAQGEIVKIKIHLDLNGKAQSAVVSKSDNGWTIDPPFDLPLSEAHVSAWLKAVRELRAIDFAAERPSKKDLKKFLLKKPSMTAEFTVKKDRQEMAEHWEIGQEQTDNFFVHTDSRDEIYKVSKFSLRDVRNPLETLLDVSTLLKFPVEEAMQIDFARGGKELKFSRGDKGWTEAHSEVKTEAIADFLQKIRGLDPIAGDFPKTAEFKAVDRLTVRGKDKILLEMQWMGGDKDPIWWLKIGSVKERFRVPSEALKAILNTNFAPKDTHGKG